MNLHTRICKSNDSRVLNEQGRGTRKSIIICKLAIDRLIMVSRSSILSQLLELSLIYVYVQVLLKTGLRDQGIS